MKVCGQGSLEGRGYEEAGGGREGPHRCSGHRSYRMTPCTPCLLSMTPGASPHALQKKEKKNTPHSPLLEVLGESGGDTGITMPPWERLQ